jgi:hypothetical protein
LIAVLTAIAFISCSASFFFSTIYLTYLYTTGADAGGATTYAVAFTNGRIASSQEMLQSNDIRDIEKMQGGALS